MRQRVPRAVAAATKPLLAASILCLVCLSAVSVAQEANQTASTATSPTLARVFADWKARQERVKSLHFTWDFRIELPKGYVFPDDPVVGGLNAAGVKIDADGVHYTMPPSEFWSEGPDRFRDEFFMVLCTGPNDWKQTARIRATIEGKRNTRLKLPIGSDEEPHATIWNKVKVEKRSAWSGTGGNPQWDARDIDLVPLLLTFRPFHPTLGWSPERCRVVSEDAMVGNVHCVAIQMDDFRHSETCWVDPARDNVIVFWEKSQRRTPSVSVTIEYQRDKAHGWIPSRWKRELAGSKPSAMATGEAIVTRYAINEKLPAETFAPAFPPGTRVFDASADGLFPSDTVSDRASVKPPQPTAPSLDTIVAAWSKRQAKTKSLRFTWHKDLIEQNLSAEDLEFLKKMPANRGKRRPVDRPDYVASQGTDTLCVDGERCALNGGFDTFVPQLQPVQPVMLAYRPLDPRLGRIKPSAYRVSPIRDRIGDANCVILEMIDEGRPRNYYWLDPARDYIVLREQVTLDGVDRSRLDIFYRHDKTDGWVPSSWNGLMLTEGGDVMQSVTVTVSEFAINPPIPSAEFQPEFPKGK
jgi:hypothetical protein